MGEPVGKSPQGHNARINSVAVSPVGTLIVSASEDRTIRMWDLKAGISIGNPLEGHDDGVSFVTFSPMAPRSLQATRTTPSGCGV